MRYIFSFFETDNNVTVRTNFNVDSESAGRDVWLDITDDGQLTGNF